MHSAWAKGTDRVYRGGSWDNDARNCRSAYRNRRHPDDRNSNLGLRLAAAHLPAEAGG